MESMRTALKGAMAYVIIGVIVNTALVVVNHGKPGVTTPGIIIVTLVGYGLGLWKKQPTVGMLALLGGYVAVQLVASQLV